MSIRVRVRVRVRGRNRAGVRGRNRAGVRGRDRSGIGVEIGVRVRVRCFVVTGEDKGALCVRQR